MTTSSSFPALFRQIMTSSKNASSLQFHVFPLCEASVSCSFGALFWILSLLPGIMLSHSFSFMSLTSWMMETFSSPADISFHIPLSDGAHRHFPVNKVRARVTSLVTKVQPSSNKIGFKFKVVGMRALKLEGSSPYRGSLNWR